jgi:hypothetical protein
LYDGYNLKNNKKNIEQEVTILKSQINSVSDFRKEFGIDPLIVMEMVKAKDEANKYDSTYFELLKKISQMNTSGAKTSKIDYKKTETGFSLELSYNIIASNFKDVSELILASESFDKNVKEALKDYKVTIKGLLSEQKEFKIGADNKSEMKDLTLTVSIGNN